MKVNLQFSKRAAFPPHHQCRGKRWWRWNQEGRFTAGSETELSGSVSPLPFINPRQWILYKPECHKSGLRRSRTESVRFTETRRMKLSQSQEDVSKGSEKRVGRREFVKRAGATTGLYLFSKVVKAASPPVECVWPCNHRSEVSDSYQFLTLRNYFRPSGSVAVK